MADHPNAAVRVIHSALAQAHVHEATLRRVAMVAAAVVLVTAGVLLGMHLNSELGATLIAAGVHMAMEGFITGHDTRRNAPRLAYAPALA